jgi:hypothetical protein
VYCLLLCVLFVIVCAVCYCVYFLLLFVLFVIVCSVCYCVYCLLLCVLFVIVCTVCYCVYCLLLLVSLKLDCTYRCVCVAGEIIAVIHFGPYVGVILAWRCLSTYSGPLDVAPEYGSSEWVGAWWRGKDCQNWGGGELLPESLIDSGCFRSLR